MPSIMLSALSSRLLRLLPLLFMTAFVLSCHKDPRAADGLGEDTFTINFDVQDVFSSVAGANTSSNNTLPQAADLLNATVEYLYFWSFNNESLQADIAIQQGASITYNNGLVPSNFAEGWPYEQFAAGRALSITGARELVFDLPIQAVASLSNFGFDISSSATGAKAFDLYYNYANTEEWQVLRANNQFSNFLTSQARNSFVFDLSDLEVNAADHIRLRIVPTAGERGSGSNYNENAGVLRLDNVRLQGIFKAPERHEGDQLRIYAFNQRTGTLASSIIQAYDASIRAISMELPFGDYRFSFLRHTGASDPLFPALVSSADTYYFGNRFSAYAGEIYGSEKSILINQNSHESVILDRYYSQIKFQFTDSRDLSVVDRVVIVRTEEPNFYAPFNRQLANPILDQSEIELRPNLILSKELQFNQFIGRVNAPINLSYQLIVFGRSDEILRTFTVSTTARNNVQVIFRGELLGELPFQASFQVEVNEEWDDSVEVQF